MLNLIIVFKIGCSQLIGQLEEQNREMKETWDRKEEKLTQERDKALDAAKLVLKHVIGCSQLIGQLEEQVREMKESWDRKEEKLTQERDKALDAAK